MKASSYWPYLKHPTTRLDTEGIPDDGDESGVDQGEGITEWEMQPPMDPPLFLGPKDMSQVRGGGRNRRSATRHCPSV